MDLWKDFRYGVRRLIDAPWFTLAAVVALALGIGANVTVFTFVNAVLLRGLPFEDQDRIMAVWTENQQSQRSGVSLPDLEDVRAGATTFSDLAGHLGSTVNLADDDQAPEQIQGAYVTGNYFSMLGVQPVLGRDLTEADDRPGAEPVVLIGYSVWQSRYGGSPDVLGRPIRVNSLLATIVGVMGPDMRFPQNTDLWIPQTNLPPASDMANRGTRSLNAVGRLSEDATLDQARGELRAIGDRLAEAYPDTNAEMWPGTMGFNQWNNGGEIRMIFLTLMGAVAFVLLIACANVANLLLARSAERSKEIAVRVSMGATRGRIVRQLLVESLIIAVLAGVVGLGLSIGGIGWFDSVTQNVGKPYWMVFSIDGIVFVFIAAICVATAILFGLAPALHVSGTDVNSVLKEGTRGGSGGFRARRWAAALIVGEVVLTLVLLSGAGFMMRSFMNLYSADTGVETANITTMRMYMPLTKYPDPEPRAALYRDFLERLWLEPNLQSVALTTSFPMGGGAASPVEIDGSVTEQGVTPPVVTRLPISPGYFEVLGVELLQGREFTTQDGQPGSMVAIVNQRFADVHFEGGNAIGHQIRLGGVEAGGDGDWLTVVGVSPTIRQRFVEEREPDPVAYVPLEMDPQRGIALMVRSAADPSEVAADMREVLRVVEPDLPVFEIMSLDQVFAQERWPFRVFGTLFATFAGIALVLSAVGLYSVTAHSVMQRVREFGIRISLGAEPREVSWLALRRVLTYLGVGVPVGALGAVGVGMILQSILVQTSPGDPLTLAGVVLVMVLVAVAACLVPARRAARLDPVAALRID